MTASLYRRSELLESGLSRRAIDGAVRDGRLRRVRSGWYIEGDADVELVHAARLGARLTCVSAARRWGLWCPPDLDRRTHLERPGNAHARAAPGSGSVVHWSRVASRVTSHRDRLVVDASTALRQMCVCQDPETAFVVVESALERGLIGHAELRAIVRTLPAGRRAALLTAGDRSGSGTESAFAFRMRRLGIPVEQQVQIGPDRVDVVLGTGLVVELDSRAFHDPVRDSARDARLSIRGYDTLRFSYEQVWFDWPQVVASIAAVRARRAHQRTG